MTQRTKGPRYYTTKKSPSDFMSEIIGLLSDYGCGSYMVEQEAGQPSAVAFRMGGLAYRIRPNVEGIGDRFGADDIRPPEHGCEAVGAQARHLLEMQLEAIESGAGRASEVLGGYVLTESGRTVGDNVR